MQLISFDTEGFSDYGISTTAVTSSVSELVATISDVSELSGNSFAILSTTQTYAMLAELNTNGDGLKKTSTSSTALAELPQWTFEYVSGSGSSGEFYIYYEDDDGTKYYLYMSSSGALTLTETKSEASQFTVTVNSTGTVTIYDNGYYINQYNGDSSNAERVGFKGYYLSGDSGNNLYLFQQVEELDEFRLWVWYTEVSTSTVYANTAATGVLKYIDENNAVWCLIPVSYFETALESYGYTFNSAATDICPFQYAPSAYAATENLTDAYYFEYNGNWYVAVQDTVGEDPYRSNVYYTGSTTKAVVEDNIINDGTFVATVYIEGVKMTDYTGCTFTWYKSEDDGVTYTEVTDSSVLEGNTINVAEDQGGLCYYYFEVTLADGTTVMTSEPLQVAYATELLNGSFENPSWDSQSGQHDEDDIPYWNTTASDNKIEIGRYEADPLVYGATDTASTGAGEQFAELNAATASALYQDVLTAPGEDLFWSLLHRARNAAGNNDFVGTVTTSTSTDTVTEVETEVETETETTTEEPTEKTTTTSSTSESGYGQNKTTVKTETTTKTTTEATNEITKVTTTETTTTTTTETTSTTYTAEDTMYVVIMSASDAEKLLDGVSDSDQQDVLTAMIEAILQGNTEGEGTYTLVSGNSAGETVEATIWEITTESTVTVNETTTTTTVTTV